MKKYFIHCILLCIIFNSYKISCDESDECKSDKCLINNIGISSNLFHNEENKFLDLDGSIYNELRKRIRDDSISTKKDIILLNNNTDNTANQELPQESGIAERFLIVLILLPFIAAAMTFLLCCKYVFFWCSPRTYVHRDYPPPLLIRTQYNNPNNFNAF
jgi:hypothetical protein